MRHAFAILSAVVIGVFVGTILQGVMTEPLLTILPNVPRSQAAVDGFGKFITAAAAIAAFGYYRSRLEDH